MLRKLRERAYTLLISALAVWKSLSLRQQFVAGGIATAALAAVILSFIALGGERDWRLPPPVETKAPNFAIPEGALTDEQEAAIAADEEAL